MSIKDELKQFRIEHPVDRLTIVQVAPSGTVPVHAHREGYIVVPFLSGSAERITYAGTLELKREPLIFEPLLPYYVEAPAANQTISLTNTGPGFSVFQKCVPFPPITGPQPELPTKQITIVSQGNNRHSFIAELAVTLLQQAVGLMFRPSLAPDRGMLFVWLFPREVVMYMRNTLVPLDILFFDEDLKISHIYPNAQPKHSNPIRSKGKVILTLEVPGGTAEKLGIRVGDTIE